MEPGSELDAWMAGKVMEWHPWPVTQVEPEGFPAFYITPSGRCQVARDVDAREDWSPSTDWRAAGEVIEKMGRTQMPRHVGPTRLHSLRSCATRGPWEAVWCSDFGYTDAVAGKTGPHAIALAAKAAMESKDG